MGGSRPSRSNPEATKDEESYRDVDGVWIHNYFSDDAIRSAAKYKPRPGYVIIVTYPKCGTQWMQFLIWNIMSKANPGDSLGEYGLICLYLEMVGAQGAEIPSRSGPITTHLPMRAFPPVEQAKYIYVARNPYDCAVSSYHMIKGLTPKTVTDVSLERFFSMFVNGKVIYGHYFYHLLPWYERRHDANVLFITYEQLKADTREEVLRIGDFLGKEHGDALRKDSDLLKRVIDGSSVESMKAFFKGKIVDKVNKVAEAAREKLPPVEILLSFPANQVETHEGSGVVRKGILGDWKNCFTPEQIERTRDWIERKTHGSDVITLWKDCGVP